MPDGVIEGKFFPGVKDGSQCVRQSATDKPEKASSGQGLPKRFNGKDDDPPHQNISNSRDNSKAMNEKYFE